MTARTLKDDLLESKVSKYTFVDLLTKERIHYRIKRLYSDGQITMIFFDAYFEDGEKLTFENRFWNIPGTKFPREDSPFNLASRLDDIVSDKNYWDKK